MAQWSSPAVHMHVSWVWRSIFVLGALLCTFLTLIQMVNEHIVSGLIWFLMSCFCISLLIRARSYLTVDHTMLLLYSTLRGTYMLPWNEVETIETDSRAFVVRGNQKTLFFSLVMGNARKREVFNRIMQEAELRHIPIRIVQRVPLTNQQNTKVR